MSFNASGEAYADLNTYLARISPANTNRESLERLRRNLPRAMEEVLTPTQRVYISSVGWAIRKLRCGFKLRRRGWNGKGIFIKLQVPDEHSKMTSPCIYIDTTGLQSANEEAPRSCVPWLASQTDMLAEGWEIVT